MHEGLSDVRRKVEEVHSSNLLQKIFHENLVTVERAKAELTLNRPIYVEFAILDLSKTLMYDFHYNYIKRKYPVLTLLFTDIDSLT